MPAKFAKLTRPEMRKLAPGQKASEHGITFERLEDGNGRFTVNVMVDGQRIHRVVGLESDGVTREKAEQLIEQLRTDARHGRLNLPKARKTPLGFEEASQRYLTKLEGSGGKDVSRKRQRFASHLTPFFGGTPPNKLTAFDMERYKKHRKDQGAASATVNRELAALSHFMSKAMEWGWVDTKPKMQRFQENNARIVYLTQEQIDRLLQAAKLDLNPQVYPFIAVGLGSAMRRMEILSIRLENIDLARQVIFIPQAKAGAREQPITGQLAGLLRLHIEQAGPDQEWLFPSPGSASGHTVSIEKPFRRVVLAAGMDPAQVVRHTLRHTAITHLVQAGVDLPTAQRISGHKTLSMVARYSHQNGEHIRSAMDRLEARTRGGNLAELHRNYTDGLPSTPKSKGA